MRLLLPRELPQVPLERVIRHSALGGFVMLAVVGAPAVFASAYYQRVASSFAHVPPFFWVVAAPMALVGLLVWLLVLQAASSSAKAGLLPTNWLLRVSGAGIGIQLRSYRNAHFRQDVPTVLWLEPTEIVCARKVRESGWIQGPKGKQLVLRFWLELELQDVDCALIEKRLAEERADQGPEIRVLGFKTRARFNEMPVYFVRPGVLRVEWLGQKMLDALKEQVEIAPELKLDLDQALGTELEPRVKALCARGMQITAIQVVSLEKKLSLSDAKKYVEELDRKAA